MPTKLNKSGENIRGIASQSGERKSKDRLNTSNGTKRGNIQQTIAGIINSKDHQ